MAELVAFLILGAILASLLAMIVAPLVIAWRERRYDRRRIIADGAAAVGVVTGISRPDRAGRQKIAFEFVPTAGGRPVRAAQETSERAVGLSQLMAGSSIQVRYRAKAPGNAFIPNLVLAERSGDRSALDWSREAADQVFYVSFGPLPSTGSGFPTRGLRWVGPGDVGFIGPLLKLSARVSRSFRTPKAQTVECEIANVRNVEVFGDRIALEIVEPGRPTKSIRFRATSALEAAAIAARLPKSTSTEFAPAMAEAAGFATGLTALSRWAPVTYALVAINVAVFVICAFNGAGVFTADAQVIIRFGSDYTPLTIGGEWWRLFTSTFLHFGLIHLAFNMYALSLNGAMAERIFGSMRYLLIYVCAGLAGSVASLCWHPIVNGAGASGAIFGIFGALLAFFLRSPAGVPASVGKRQRTSVALFIAYTLLNGSRIQGIDNAAHLGGLCAGFVVGLLLVRPLDTDRATRSWAGQWQRAAAAVAALSLAIGYSLATGRLHPRLSADEQGRPIPQTALGAWTEVFDGVRLNSPATEVLKTKGEPVRRPAALRWTYNSLDARHDGLIDVDFAGDGTEAGDTVRGVIFSGTADAAPEELPYLSGRTLAEVTAIYGPPLQTRTIWPGRRMLWFRRGVVLELNGDRVVSYGIFARPD